MNNNAAEPLSPEDRHARCNESFMQALLKALGSDSPCFNMAQNNQNAQTPGYPLNSHQSSVSGNNPE